MQNHQEIFYYVEFADLLPALWTTNAKLLLVTKTYSTTAIFSYSGGQVSLCGALRMPPPPHAPAHRFEQLVELFGKD